MSEFYARIASERDGQWRWELRYGPTSRVSPGRIARLGYKPTKDQAIEAAREAKALVSFKPEVLEIDL